MHPIFQAAPGRGSLGQPAQPRSGLACRHMGPPRSQDAPCERTQGMRAHTGTCWVTVQVGGSVTTADTTVLILHRLCKLRYCCFAMLWWLRGFAILPSQEGLCLIESLTLNLTYLACRG